MATEKAAVKAASDLKICATAGWMAGNADIDMLGSNDADEEENILVRHATAKIITNQIVACRIKAFRLKPNMRAHILASRHRRDRWQ